jgi:hypothetical protein
MYNSFIFYLSLFLFISLFFSAVPAGTSTPETFQHHRIERSHCEDPKEGNLDNGDKITIKDDYLIVSEREREPDEVEKPEILLKFHLNYPQFVIYEDNLTSIIVNFCHFKEVSPKHNTSFVYDLDFKEQNWCIDVDTITDDNINEHIDDEFKNKTTRITYHTRAKNGAHIEVTNYVFHEKASFIVDFTEDESEVYLTPGNSTSNVFSLFIKDWPFKSKNNTLHSCLNYTLNKPLEADCNGIDHVTVTDGRIIETNYYTEDVQVQISEITAAVIDGEKLIQGVLTRNDAELNKSSLVFPYFEKSLFFDPSVSLYRGTLKECIPLIPPIVSDGIDEDKKEMLIILIGTFVGICCVIIILAAVISLLKKRRKKDKYADKNKNEDRL